MNKTIKGRSMSPEELFETIVHTTIEATRSIFSSEHIGTMLLAEIGEERIKNDETELFAMLDKLMNIHDENHDRFEEIAEDIGLSEKTVELVFIAPFVHSFLEDNVKVGETVIADIGTESKGGLN